jgi:hypothetical protein
MWIRYKEQLYNLEQAGDIRLDGNRVLIDHRRCTSTNSEIIKELRIVKIDCESEEAAEQIYKKIIQRLDILEL